MIRFHFEDIPLKRTLEKSPVRSWLKTCITNHRFLVGEINYVFCSDDFLLGINKKYLNHDYYTDVITFDYTENKVVSGDVYISYDRIKDNAEKSNIHTKDELHRVMVHGLLHLMGYKDKEQEEQRVMREEEDKCLSLRSF